MAFLKTFVVIAATLIGAKAFALPADIEFRADEIVSLFENSTLTIPYDYIEDIGDGRGYTAGKIGFTTANGDLLQVVDLFLSREDNAQLRALRPTLAARASAESGSTAGLTTLPALWVQLAQDPVFRQAQDDVCEQTYKVPARNYALRFHIQSALGYLIFYDSVVQHGDGDDPDSFTGILNKMTSHPTTEPEFLDAFLTSREKDLLNPADADSADAWRESVDRVYALRRLMTAGKWDLGSPLLVNVWQTDYQVAHMNKSELKDQRFDFIGGLLKVGQSSIQNQSSQKSAILWQPAAKTCEK